MRPLSMILGIFLMVMLLMPATGAFSRELVNEGFEAPLLPEQSQVPGRTGLGWTQPATGENLLWPVSLADAQVGMISFDLKRLAVSGTGGADTVFELLDENGFRVLRMQVNWTAPAGGMALYLNSLPSRDYLQYGIRLWNPTIYLGREVPPGDWVHMDLVWDDVRGEYHAFADGISLNAEPEKTQLGPDGNRILTPRFYANEEAIRRGEPLPYPEKPFQFFLQRVTRAAVGHYPIPNLPEGRGGTLLSNSVLDNFEIRVDTLTSIASVTHDAFERAGYSGKLVPGDTFTVTLTAEPGGAASFDIVAPEPDPDVQGLKPRGDFEGIPLAEDPGSPGTYVGTYTIGYGQYMENGQVSGRFRNSMGYNAPPLAAARPVQIDGRVQLSIEASGDLMPADRSSRVGFTVTAKNANGKAVPDHELKLTMSTTDEYTGTVGGGTFEDLVGGEIDVDWGGVTDSFGEVTAQYVSGFAAKTILVSAKDMVSGDVGVGWVRSYIEGEIDIVVTKPQAGALSAAGSMEVFLSREWLTADGRSRSRITAVIRDASDKALAGHNVQFALLGDNGQIRVVQSKTDTRGRAFADYIAGTVMGQVQVEVRDLTSGMVAIVGIELRPDAPAEIELAADPGEVETGGQSTVSAKVTDANGNPNSNVDVLYDVSAGEGTVSAPSVATDDKGFATVKFTAGDVPGLVTVRGTVISREPTQEEISAAEGAVFLFGLEEDPGRLEVFEWLVRPSDEVVQGQDLVVLEDRSGGRYTVVAPRDGTVATFTAEERDITNYGDTLGYILLPAE